MKRFMKGCATAALILAVLGGVFTIIGGSLAGRDVVEQALEDATGGRIRVNPGPWWSWAIHMGSGRNSEKALGEKALEEAVPIDRGIPLDTEGDSSVGFGMDYSILGDNGERFRLGGNARNLEIDLGGCNFSTEYIDGDDIYLEVTNADKFKGYVEGNTLYIKSDNSNINTWSEINDYQVILYLPFDYAFDDVEISMGAGIMNFSNLYAKDASLEVGAGQISIDYAEVEDLDVTVGAGSAEISYMDVVNLEAEVGMGEFTAYGEIGYEADVECSMGNIELLLEGREKDFNYEIESAMGNVDLGSSSFSGLGEERHIENGAGKSISVECSMGNITISFIE